MYADFFVVAISTLTDLSLYDYLMKKQEDYYHEFFAVEDVSPDDYDSFCRATKQNDVRKYTSLFYANLLKRGVFTHEQMLHLIRRLLSRIQCLSTEPTKSPNQIAQLESLVDNVSVLIMFTQSRLSRMDTWYDEFVPSLYDITPECNERITFAWKRLLETVDA